MAQAILRYGDPVMIPYTPASAVTAGDIIVSGAKCFIAHSDISANVQGAVAVRGGVYEILANGGSGGDTIALGDKVYWDDVNNTAEEVSSGTPLGWCAEAKTETATTVLVEHGAW